MLEYDDVASSLGGAIVARPADGHGAQLFGEPDRQRTRTYFICDKTRPCQKIKHRPAEDQARCRVHSVSCSEIRRTLRELTAKDMAGMSSEPGDYEGIEALYAGLSLILFEHLQSLQAKLFVPLPGFQLNYDRLSAVYELKHLRKKRHGLF